MRNLNALLLVLLHLHYDLTQSITLECPKDWVELKSTVSCYKFQRYPLLTVNEARQRCQSDGAYLLAVESIIEHMFIQRYLADTDIEQRKWYTSGSEAAGRWTWASINAPFSYDQGWLQSTQFDIGSNLVYVYRLGQWGWLRDPGTEARPFICEIPIKDSWKVVTERRLIDHCLPSTIELRFIPRGPTIIEQPKDIEFGNVDSTILGSTYQQMQNDIIVTLKCLADGYPIPQYEWYKGRIEAGINSEFDFYPVDLSNERYFQHGGNLIISRPISDDSGTYYCKASNAYGVVNSNTMQLREIVLGRFEKRERPKVIAQGFRESVINCLYRNTNTEDINYIWFYQSLNQKVQQSKERFISRNGNLYFSRVTNGDAGEYICAVASSNHDLRYVPSQTSDVTRLEIVGSQGSERDPRIWPEFPIVFPNRKLPRIGNNVTIECIAEGYPIPTYKWYRLIDDQKLALPAKSLLINFNRVLLIPNVQREDAGLYQCYVENYRNSHSRTVYLQLEIEPMFTVPLDDQVLDVGASIDWYCEATGNIGSTIQYTWYVNGTLLNTGTGTGDDKTRLKALGNVLKISGAQRIDSGMYQCAALNTQNSIVRYSSAELRVIECSPTFIKKPMQTTQRAAIQGNVTLVCNPEGAPRPKIQWYQNGFAIGKDGRRDVLENGNILVTMLSKSDEGNYTCEATNRLGRTLGYTFLYIVDGTRIDIPADNNVFIQVNQTQVLPCRAYAPAHIDLSYMWRFNGEPVVIDSVFFAQDIFNRMGDLRIIRAQYTREGQYMCIAKTTADEKSIVYNVRVVGAPGPSAGVKCYNVGTTTATVSWVVGTDHGDPIVNFTIEGKTDRSVEWMPIKVNFTMPLNPSGEYSTTVEDLAAWSSYQFRVSASNRFGFGTPSAPADSCNTNMDVPGAAPANVSGGGGKIGDLRVTWAQLPVEHWNGDGLVYMVYYRKKGVITAWEEAAVPFGTTTFVAYIEGSAPYSPYEVQVSAKNVMGEGPRSNVTFIFSAEGIPRKPVSNVKCEPYNSTAILVTWDMIGEDDFSILQGKLLGYVVRYWKYDLEENMNYWRKRFLGQRNSAIIIGLEPDTIYFVRVRVYNSAGESVESELFSHRTFRKAPMMPPQYVKVYQPEKPKDKKVMLPDKREMYKLFVEWKGVSTNNDEEPLEGYMIKVWEYYQSIRNATIFYAAADAYKIQIDNIFKNRNYRLRVQGWSLGGEGKLSSPIKEFRVDNDGRLLILYNPDTSLMHYNGYFNGAVSSRRLRSDFLFFAFYILSAFFNYI